MPTSIKRVTPKDDLGAILQDIIDRLNRLEAPGVAYGNGPPTGTPDAPTIYIDVTNNRLYAYTTSWKSTAVT